MDGKSDSGEKRSKIEKANNNNGGKEDRLSSLPDAILLDILSLLPIRTTVVTSILSRRWRCLWKHASVFQLLPMPNFYPVVHHIIPQLAPQVIEFFQLFSPFPPSEYLDFFTMLIRQISGRILTKLEVIIVCKEFSPLVPLFLPLPSCVFESDSLEVLILGNKLDYSLPDNGINLPNLRKLHICVHDHHVGLIGMLSKSCPKLEELLVNGKLRNNDDHTLDISAENLKRLTIKIDRRILTSMVIAIDAPSLEHYDVSGPVILSHSFLKTQTALVEAKLYPATIDYKGPDNARRALVLMKSVYNVRSLTLSCSMLRGLPSVNCCTLPVFDHLTCLKVNLEFLLDWKGLMHFLRCCPNLEVLVMRAGDERWSDMNWTHDDNMPTCLLTKVKKIVVEYFEGIKHEVELMSFLLSSANVLDLLNIGVHVSTIESERQLCNELDFCRELFLLPRSSPTCRIIFSGVYVDVASGKGMKVGSSKGLNFGPRKRMKTGT